MYCVTAACGCNMGKVRGNNEDNFYFGQRFLPKDNTGLDGIIDYQSALDQPVFFGVFDGMGGESYGEEAAYLAARTMYEQLQTEADWQDNLMSICINANQRICQATRRYKAGLMGTTAVLLGLKDTNAYLVNIGDSRAFLYRSEQLHQVSVDHTDQCLFATLGMTNRKPRLTQHLGIEPEDMIIEPYKTKIRIQNEDLFLLCSDGLTDMVPEKEIKNIIDEGHEVKHTADLLIKQAMNYGGKDNITIVICKINEKE